MTFTDDMTLGDARAELRELVEAGHDCPCCSRLAKVYQRPIHSGMARALIDVYRQSGTNWVQNPDAFVKGRMSSGGDPLKLRYWGLLERGEGVREDGSSRVGWWRVTEQGRAFVMRQITVPKYARIYDGRCLGLAGDPVSIVDALGDKFDYDEIMQPATLETR